MGGQWIVQEGYLLCKSEKVVPTHNPLSPTAAAQAALRHLKPQDQLVERYVVLSMNRKLEFFDNNSETRVRIEAAYLQGFCGWDGDGLLKVDSYGIELKLEKKANTRMLVAAFNRLDLDKWCRAFQVMVLTHVVVFGMQIAVLDPNSAAGEEVRRERRRMKKEAKRLEEERAEKIRLWKEKKAKMIEEEKRRLQAREEEINQMTPLERIDDIGSLDDETVRILEKRKLRLLKHQAVTTERMNRAAYRRRMEEAAGGKLENVQPLQTKVVEQKSRIVRVELPPPGQFIEAAGTIRHPDHFRLRGSSGSESSLGNHSDRSSFSTDSRMSSGHSGASVSRLHRDSWENGTPPPPPPPPRSSSVRRSSISTSSQFTPPPPPPPRSGFIDVHRSNDVRSSRSNSVHGSFSYDDDASDRRSEFSRASFSQSQRRHSTIVDKEKQNIQDSLASILSGRQPSTTKRRDSRRRDSIDSTSSFASTASTRERKKKTGSNGGNNMVNGKSNGDSGSTITNAFAASLAAIRNNRADTMDETTFGNNPTVSMKRNRKRDSQLSAEGKELLQKAISIDEQSTKTSQKNATRKGLFDDSSGDEDDDSNSGLFGTSKHRSELSAPPDSNGRSSQRSAKSAPVAKSRHSLKDDNDESMSSDSDSESVAGISFLDQTRTKTTSPTSETSSILAPIRKLEIMVKHVSSAVQLDAKKPIGVYTFAFQLDNMQHTFSYSYQQFEEIHSRLLSEFPIDALPKFPSKHWYRNNTKPENMQKRALEFVQYLQQLVAVPGMVSNERFVFEFHIGGQFADALRGKHPNSDKSTTRASNGIASRTGKKSHDVVSPTKQSQARGTPKTKKSLFSAADSDSESDFGSDVSREAPTPITQKRRGSSIHMDKDERRRTKPVKPSKKDFTFLEEDEEPRPRRSSRPNSRASHKSTNGPIAQTTAEAPKINVTGLPARPNPFGGGRGDLLAAIRGGTQLRKVGESDSSTPSMAAAGSVPARPPPPPPPMNGAESISEAISNAMAARRIHVEYEESHSDVEDSDDDWD